VGERAPALKLPLLGGGTINLASLKGKPVWLNFMGTYCPPCRDEFPVMSGFQARYASTGLVILAVDVREDTELIQSFVGETGATFAVALDRDGAAQKAWGAVALPTHYWIDASGVVRDGALGGIGPDQMAESLGRILPGVTVTP
jgi:cytochrome c biogenesis protein CcmG/thiol:disulfide interchange protein DsbE